jgi:hypothetical protein
VLGLFLTLALVLALAFAGHRWQRRARMRRRLAALPGGSVETALAAESFSAIDEEIRRRRCPCGGRFDAYGEGSREDGGSRLRVISIECRFCERQSRVFFDVTGLYH